MPQNPALQRPLVFLAALAVVLPIAICVILAVARLLGAMGDIAGRAVLDRVATGCGILWAVDLICLVLALAVRSIADNHQPPEAQ